jgi:N-succinyldiaminopimelate aminotransferase
MDPFTGGRAQDLRVEENEHLHGYSNPRGRREAVDAVVEKVRSFNRIPCERESVVLTAGATGALAASLGMIADPGDEVLLMSPFWPLIPGIVRNTGAVPVEVPFYDRVHSVEETRRALGEAVTSRTVAVYVSTPSNPTGRVLPEDQIEAVAGLARDHGLWILSDEVYENYVYRGEHVSIARFAPERTLTVFSFSKAYGMAGNRTGYLVGPVDAVQEVLKVTTHTVYSAPTAGQVAGALALKEGGGWLAAAVEAYRAIGDEVAAVLGIPSPEGSTFLFCDVAHLLDGRGIWGFLEDCLDDDVVLAPGGACGSDYETWVRLCYTSIPPADVREAAARVARRMGAVAQGG